MTFNPGGYLKTGALTNQAQPRRSFAISRLALAPGAPVTPPPGMRARAAEVEAAHGRAVLRPVEERAHREELVERRLAVEDVAARQAEGLLEVDGRQDLPRRRRAPCRPGA